MNVHLRGLSPELHQRLRAAADQNRRSLNGEILARLEDSLASEPVDPAELLERIRARSSRLRIPSFSADTLRAWKESGRA
jgi:plasmid stability protein